MSKNKKKKAVKPKEQPTKKANTPNAKGKKKR